MAGGVECEPAEQHSSAGQYNIGGKLSCGVDGHGKQRWWSVVNLVPVDSQQWLKNYGAAAVSL